MSVCGRGGGGGGSFVCVCNCGVVSTQPAKLTLQGKGVM